MSLNLNVGICPILWVFGGTLGTQGIAFLGLGIHYPAPEIPLTNQGIFRFL